MDQNGIIARQVAKYRAALGWTAERLSRESGLELAVVEGVERGGIGLTVEDLIRLATALDVTPGTLMTISHPLEAQWTCDAWDILTAVERGHRAQVDVKGKLAEYFLHEYLRRLETMLPGLVVRSWNDTDGDPDFDLVWNGQPLRVECKNARSLQKDRAIRGAAEPIRVELQKTRNSKDGSPTRGYRFEDFQVLAVCLFNRRRDWRYAFCATRRLLPRPDDPQVLKIMQVVPDPPVAPWATRIETALDDAIANS